MISDLTPRQLEFLKGLHELTLVYQTPVHYSQVARHLGVNPYSAYDMLKLLETKKLAATDYVLSAGKDGPGRSRIVFYPTGAGLALLRRVASAEPALPVAPEEWAAFKEGILRRLREVRSSGSRELLADMVARLPERRRPLHYCAQMVSVLVLNLQHAQEKMAAVNPFDALNALIAHQDEDLSALAGLSLGSALVVEERSDVSLACQLVGHMRGFQDQLNSLSIESKSRLRTFLEEAIQVFAPSSSAPVPVATTQDQA